MTYLFAVTVAALGDTFFVSGYVLYGTGVGVVASVAVLAEQHFLAIYAAIVVGAFLGDIVNYLVGRHFGGHYRVQSTLVKMDKNPWFKKIAYHESDSLQKRGLLALLFRFVAVTRPVHTILLGMSSSKALRDLPPLLFATLLWAAFWLTVFTQTVNLFT